MKRHTIGKKMLLVMGLTAMCILVGAPSLTEAKNRRKTITFTEDVMLNETSIKKGTYNLKFNSAESTVLLLKNGDTVASAKVHVEMGERKALYNSASFKATDKGKLITSITFAGDKRILMVDGPAH
jgi:hypothetical protein